MLATGLPLDEIKKRIGLLYAGVGLPHRGLAYYLAEVDERCLHHLAGGRTVSQFAAVTFGMSRRGAWLRGLGGEPERLVVPEGPPIASVPELPAELDAAWWAQCACGAHVHAARVDSAQCACDASDEPESAQCAARTSGTPPRRRSHRPVRFAEIVGQTGIVEALLFRLGLATATPAGRAALPRLRRPRP